MSTTFAGCSDRFFREYFRLYATHATDRGNHDHDGRWPNLTDAGSQDRLAWLTASRAELAALDPAGLTSDEAIDRRVLLTQIDALRFDEEELDEPSWNPLFYTYLFGDGLFSLISREFAPLNNRLRSAASRMRALPTALDQARANLERQSERAVSAFHTEKAIETMPGVADLCRDAVTECESLDDDALQEEVRAAGDEAVAAIEAFTSWLRDDLVLRAEGDFRLGRELYERKLHHALKTTIAPGDLEIRAAAAYDEVRAEMLALARRLWPTWIGDEPMPTDGNVLTRRVLDAIGTEHPKADNLLDYCRAEHARIEEFVRGTDLVGLTDESLEIIWTPPFLRAAAGAMLIAPGPLDSGLKSFFAITPPPEDWTDDEVDSMLRENNSRQLRLLTIHEAVPGHYLQLAWSNRCPSLARAVFENGVFVEGWAVYVTQVMMDVGYGVEDPALLLSHWKFHLRSITNTLLDIRVHTSSMTEGEAMALMVDGGFQEQAEATGKWSRARLSSTQLCEYFLGSVEMTELEHDARRRAVHEGRQFEWRPFLESVLSHGTPPMPILREVLSGELG